jgi:hypothetical protein
MGNRRFGVRLAGLTFLFCALCTIGVAAKAGASTESMRTHSSARLDARCAGDTIFGELRTDAPAGSSFVLALYQRRVKTGPWLPTRQAAVIVTRRRQHSYPFSFDVASYGAWAYAIKGASRDQILLGASCAPGHQVPEAPNVLLLAAAVAGVFGVSLARRRRRWIIR